MKVVHYSPYPDMTIREFHRLMNDGAYQDALAAHGKLTRDDVDSHLTEDGLESSWSVKLHRSLNQAHLMPLKIIWPRGLDVVWTEEHTYSGNTGTLQLQLQQPKGVCAVIAGVETLTMRGHTLERRIEIDLGKAKLPFAIGMIPGVQSAVAHEIDLGLSRSDNRTEAWLAEHRHRYKVPVPAPLVADVLDAGSDTNSTEDVFEDAAA